MRKFKQNLTLIAEYKLWAYSLGGYLKKRAGIKICIGAMSDNNMNVTFRYSRKNILV